MSGLKTKEQLATLEAERDRLVKAADEFGYSEYKPLLERVSNEITRVKLDIVANQRMQESEGQNVLQLERETS